jgi:hypothetical protein
MRGGVFICYRREDSAGFAGRIYDRLKMSLGRESVFIDVDNIPAGRDFVEVLTERVGRCDALVALIGKNWLASADKDNRRRLDDPNDFVRIEIEAALERNVPVIPVLVDGAVMPQADDLPQPLKKFARRQGIEISHDRFDSDAERLTRMLSAIEEEAAHVSDGEAPGGPRDHGGPPAPAGEGPQPAETTLTAPARVGLAGAASMAGLALLLAIAGFRLLQGGAPETRPPTADLVRPTALTALGAGASPSAPASSGTAANVAATPVVSTASLATLLADAPTGPDAKLSALLGPSASLVGAAPNAADSGPLSQDELARQIEQQKVAMAKAQPDFDRLGKEADAAVKSVRMDDTAATRRVPNAAPDSAPPGPDAPAPKYIYLGMRNGAGWATNEFARNGAVISSNAIPSVGDVVRILSPVQFHNSLPSADDPIARRDGIGVLQKNATVRINDVLLIADKYYWASIDLP